MPDPRYTDLRAVLAYEGLSDEERAWGMDFVDTETPATRAALVTSLLRGALADRGNLLDNIKAGRIAGMAAGVVLLNWLLNSNRRTERNPGGVLSEAEWQRGLAAISRQETADDVLRLLLATRATIRNRQTARLAA